MIAVELIAGLVMLAGSTLAPPCDAEHEEPTVDKVTVSQASGPSRKAV